MSLQVAQEQIADLHRRASAAHAPAYIEPESAPTSVIALRAAGADEAAELALIATLDYSKPLEGPTLVAVVDGRLVAAISLNDGRVISDPFAQTTEAKALLQTRAQQLAAPTSQRHPRRRRLLRFA